MSIFALPDDSAGWYKTGIPTSDTISTHPLLIKEKRDKISFSSFLSQIFTLMGLFPSCRPPGGVSPGERWELEIEESKESGNKRGKH